MYYPVVRRSEQQIQLIRIAGLDLRLALAKVADSFEFQRRSLVACRECPSDRHAEHLGHADRRSAASGRAEPVRIELSVADGSELCLALARFPSVAPVLFMLGRSGQEHRPIVLAVEVPPERGSHSDCLLVMIERVGDI